MKTFLPLACCWQSWLLEQEGKIGSTGPRAPEIWTPVLPAGSSPAFPQARPAHGNHLGCFSKEKRMSVPALRDPVFAGPAVPTALGFACVPSDSDTHHARWRATPGCRWGCGEGRLFWGLRREALLWAAFPPTNGKFGREQWNLWRARQGVALHGQVPLHPHPTSVSPGEPKSL